MDSRQQFEEWITTTGLDADLSRGNHGCYLNPTTHWLYCAWVASRETCVIELPDDGIEDCQREWGVGCKDTFDCGYNFSCHKHEQSINSAGIRTK